MSFRHPGSIKLFQRNTNPLSVEGRMQSWERSILPVRVFLSTTERCWNLWFIYEFMSGMIILDSFVLLSLSSNPGCLSWFVPDLTLSVSLSPFLVKCHSPQEPSIFFLCMVAFFIFAKSCNNQKLCVQLRCTWREQPLHFLLFLLQREEEKGNKSQGQERSWRRVLQVVSFDPVSYYRWKCAKKINCTGERATHIQ